MQDYHIIIALSEIKNELKLRTHSKKSLQEIRIWFVFANDMLTVHDFSSHATFIILGHYQGNKNTWSFTVDPNSLSWKFLQRQVQTSNLKMLADDINEKYKVLGFYC